LSERIHSNARIVFGDEIVRGSVVVRDGYIDAIDPGSSSLPAAMDCEGDYLLPGLIELHTDNMEKYFIPRPGVIWPRLAAILAHDKQMVSSGITTVFDAVALGYNAPDGHRRAILDDVLESIGYIHEHGLNAADHFLHLRCELCSAEVVSEFDDNATNPLLRLVSLMDHAPGQRQFARIDMYIKYYTKKYGYKEEEMARYIAEHQQASETWSSPNRRHIADYCWAHETPLASHDDATVEHVAEAVEFNVEIAEFPTTLEAAQKSHEHQLSVLMGAPNLIRGLSHSGNIAARELAEHGCLDILSSDYYPTSLLQSAFALAELDIGYDLPAAIQCVTRNPAQAVGLDDRGSIEIGKRADLLRVGQHQSMPLLKEIWKTGTRVS